MPTGTLFAAFCSGSNTERSVAMDCEKTTNLFRSTIEAQGAAKTAYLLGTPGLRTLGSVTGPGAGRGVFTQDEQTWSVVGSTLYELDLPSFVATARGTILDDGQPVSFASNGDAGRQLAVVGGGELKILDLDTNILTAAIALPLTNHPVSVGYIDGYFLLMEYDSLRIWYSAPKNGLSWDALDFFARATASDHFVNMAVANNRVWGFGNETTEAFEDVGDADTPFEPIKGSLFQIGLAGCWSLSVGINTLRWVGRSTRGGASVYQLNGYGGQRISTHAIDARLGSAHTLHDTEALTYDQDGHVFYALTVPALNQTVVWDETEQQWHDRASYDQTSGEEGTWRPRGHAYVGATHVVGSRDSGDFWALDLETYDDAGAILRAVRRAPYLGSSNGDLFLDRVELGIEPGVGLVTGQGSDPKVLLNISKDLGKTWFSAGTAEMGKMGEYGSAAIWRRLGRVRLDRLVLEIVVTDAVKRCFGPGLWITATPGRP